MWYIKITDIAIDVLANKKGQLMSLDCSPEHTDSYKNRKRADNISCPLLFS